MEMTDRSFSTAVTMYAEIRSRPQSSPIHPPFHRTLADDLATDNIPRLEAGRRRAPPRYSQPTRKVLNRTYSDESLTGYSTDSLLSILSHDSYTTPTDSNLSDDESKGKPYREERPPDPPKPKAPPTRKQKKEKKASHWEEWVVRKTQEEREKRRKQAWKEKEEKEEEERQQKEKEEKKQMTDKKHKEWAEQRTLQQKIQRKAKVRQEKAEKEIEDQKKQQIHEKAQKEYDRWLEMKQQKEEERRQKDEEDRRRKEAEKEEKQKQAEEVYNDWLKKSKTKPRPMFHSFGYTGGVLTGYHDRAAYPIPSFYNPVPWMPIHVPKEKQPKVPSKKKGGGRKKSQHQPSPPLLWKEVEQRTVRKQSSLITRKR
ncbi:coiled-coil domain-containing protein 34-like [Branchiostoma lanceolatum]|uniref:coiled-coil domain-containing protein 34-like n=1 Tax=Branchiostoma lanceolatum TaxID=7740 RepID=UPI0034550B2E